MPRRSAAAALETRHSIVDRAVDVASLEGLEGLTIGRLAGELEMSKAGVIGHFGSKEALQLAALDRAADIFRREVWEPAADLDPGADRLGAIADGWVSYLERDVFPGGCFLTAASTEWDGRSGPVRDAVKKTLDLWWRVLAAEAAAAGLDDPEQFAFEINGIAMGLNQALQLGLDQRAPERARKAMRRLLRPTAD
jgi:AcrR family transcriptional regulator